MVTVLTFMLMTTCTRTKGFVTANVTSHGPLMEYLAEQRGREIVMAQETHIVAERLAAMQARLSRCTA